MTDFYRSVKKYLSFLQTTWIIMGRKQVKFSAPISTEIKNLDVEKNQLRHKAETTYKESYNENLHGNR